MSILFSVISRGTTILARHASCVGNFSEVTELVLARIPLEDNRLSYSHGQYLFHYICEDHIIYMCITDDEFDRLRAFAFLTEIKRLFQSNYGVWSQNAVAYAMNTEFSPTLSSEMKRFSNHREDDKMTKVKSEIDDLKNIMVKNIDSIAQRGERLELLVNKTDNLTSNSVTFRVTSRNLATAIWWKNVKMMVLIAVCVIVAIYVVVSISCGGLGWPNCVG